MARKASTERLLHNIERFKRDKEADEIRQWRQATPEERWRAITELMDLAETIIRSRARPHVPDPLTPGWLPRRPN